MIVQKTIEESLTCWKLSTTLLKVLTRFLVLNVSRVRDSKSNYTSLTQALFLIAPGFLDAPGFNLATNGVVDFRSGGNGTDKKYKQNST